MDDDNINSGSIKSSQWGYPSEAQLGFVLQDVHTNNVMKFFKDTLDRLYLSTAPLDVDCVRCAIETSLSSVPQVGLPGIVDNSYVSHKVTHHSSPNGGTHVLEIEHLVENKVVKFKMSKRRAKKKIANFMGNWMLNFHYIVKFQPVMPVNYVELKFDVVKSPAQAIIDEWVAGLKSSEFKRPEGMVVKSVEDMNTTGPEVLTLTATHGLPLKDAS